MNKLAKFTARMGSYAATWAFALCLFTGSAYAQFGAAAAQPQQGSQANPLPLSGRSGASGGGGATPTAQPGTTHSANTIKSPLSIFAALPGNAPHNATTPFSPSTSPPNT